MHHHLAVGRGHPPRSCGVTGSAVGEPQPGERRSAKGPEGAATTMAMAPQQLGIGIRRHFTAPGVDPYDTVEWERRDARIPNFKDGGDAFFQAGVEFPTRWSLNAT